MIYQLETAEYIRQNKATIVWQLYNRKYQPQPVRRVEIPKPVMDLDQKEVVSKL